jgi:hypothetical protein
LEAQGAHRSVYEIYSYEKPTPERAGAGGEDRSAHSTLGEARACARQSLEFVGDAGNFGVANRLRLIESVIAAFAACGSVTERVAGDDGGRYGVGGVYKITGVNVVKNIV